MMLDNLLLNIIPVTILFSFGIANTYEEKTVYTQALLTISYAGEKKLKPHATYVDKSPKKGVKGLVFYAGQDVDWCDSLPPPVVSQIPQSHRWIALIPRGDNCTCRDKLDTAKKNNASAAIIINNHSPSYDCDETGYHVQQDIVSVLINTNDGEKLIDLYIKQRPNHLYCQINLGKKYIEKQFRVSKTSVLFVLVSFILLMCISLAWLVFYYVQRFRHIYRNDRKEKQLLSAAKKAISKLKTISFNSESMKDGDEDSCAVCLENYKDGENVRILPCKHLFHKCCIDPWLLNHRTCPMCKSNILKSLGVEIPDNIDLSQYDVESRRISREVENVQSSPAPSVPSPQEVIGEESVDPGTSVYTPPGSSSQAWSEPNVATASCCSSTSSMLSDTDSERSTVALVSIVQKV